jgi:hypothetical protein
VADFYCHHCPGRRFIGTGSGVATIRLQCKQCGSWHVVTLADTELSATDLRKRSNQGTLKRRLAIS